jgi:hypothetical protein
MPCTALSAHRANVGPSDRTCRLAFGLNAPRKALTLRVVSTGENQTKPCERISKQAGFSPHAGVAGKSYRCYEL